MVYLIVPIELAPRLEGHTLSLTGSQVTGQLEGEKEFGLVGIGPKVYKPLN